MDFLASAIYTTKGESNETLAGAMLTHFDPTDIVSRAQVFYATVDQLRSDSRIVPSGFTLDKDGILLSDTQARTTLSAPMTQYIAMELGSNLNRTPVGLLDVVLYAAKYGGRVYANAHFDETTGQFTSDGQAPILIPMRSFKVSNSSFNIYAPYKREDGGYRTCSLVDITVNESVPFVLAIPEGELPNYTPVLSFLSDVLVGDAEAIPSEFRIFKVDAPLSPFYTMCGEGFLNYLAYNVASCTIGLQVVRDFMGETGYVSADDNVPKQYERVERKVPKANVAIESSCKAARTAEVMDCLTRNDTEGLKSLMRDEEAYITFVWLKKIFNSSSSFDGKEQSDSIAAACMSLQRECRELLLHYSIELLAQRLYIYSVGILQDPYGPVLKGGGVNGYGFKRFVG